MVILRDHQSVSLAESHDDVSTISAFSVIDVGSLDSFMGKDTILLPENDVIINVPEDTSPLPPVDVDLLKYQLPTQFKASNTIVTAFGKSSCVY